MFEATRNRRKVRTVSELHLPGVAEHAAYPRRIAGQSIKRGVHAGRAIQSGRQDITSVETVRGRCKPDNTALLSPLSLRSEAKTDLTETEQGCGNAPCRSGEDVGRMDQREKGEKVIWDAVGLVAALFGGNWSNGVNAGSRASNWNNYPWNSNNNIGARGCCDDYSISAWVKALSDDLKKWSAQITCYGEYITRFA